MSERFRQSSPGHIRHMPCWDNGCAGAGTRATEPRGHRSFADRSARFAKFSAEDGRLTAKKSWFCHVAPLTNRDSTIFMHMCRVATDCRHSTRYRQMTGTAYFIYLLENKQLLQIGQILSNLGICGVFQAFFDISRFHAQGYPQKLWITDRPAVCRMAGTCVARTPLRHCVREARLLGHHQGASCLSREGGSHRIRRV